MQEERTERHDEAESRFYSAELLKLLFNEDIISIQINSSVYFYGSYVLTQLSFLLFGLLCTQAE